MIYNKNYTLEEFTNVFIEETMKSPVSIVKKIQALIKIRRENSGKYQIQDKCNKYLDKLYKKKYEMLSKRE